MPLVTSGIISGNTELLRGRRVFTALNGSDGAVGQRNQHRYQQARATDPRLCLVLVEALAALLCQDLLGHLGLVTLLGSQRLLLVLGTCLADLLRALQSTVFQLEFLLTELFLRTNAASGLLQLQLVLVLLVALSGLDLSLVCLAIKSSCVASLFLGLRLGSLHLLGGFAPTLTDVTQEAHFFLRLVARR